MRNPIHWLEDKIAWVQAYRKLGGEFEYLYLQDGDSDVWLAGRSQIAVSDLVNNCPLFRAVFTDDGSEIQINLNEVRHDEVTGRCYIGTETPGAEVHFWGDSEEALLTLVNETFRVNPISGEAVIEIPSGIASEYDDIDEIYL